MRFSGAWLWLASALALSACHRPNASAAHQPVKAAAGGPQVAKQAANDTRVVPITVSAADGAGSSGGAADRASSKPHADRQHAAASGAPTRAAATVVARSTPGHKLTAPTAPTRAVDATRAKQLASAQPARPAADRGFSPEYESCITSAHGFTVARASCHSAELARQSARVDRALKSVLATRSDDAQARLLSDQRAWIERRDSECQDAPAPASSDVLHEGSCRIDMTIQRAVKLEHMAS